MLFLPVTLMCHPQEVKKSRGLPVKKRDALTMEQETAVKAAGIAQEGRWWLFGYLLLYYRDAARRSACVVLQRY